MTDMGRYITLLRNVEAQYPNRTTSRLLDSLRALAGIDTDQFRTLLNTQPADGIQRGSRRLPGADFDELEDFNFHDIRNNREIGLAIDKSTNRSVAMSHVVAGLCGGIHRPEPTNRTQVGPIDIPFPAMTRRIIGLDPLYAVTMSGDLGQTAALQQVDSVNNTRSIWGGIGLEATAAELIGDIDGFLLGNWLSTTAAGQNVRRQLVQGNNIRLSRILSEYYRTDTTRTLGMRAGSGSPLEAIGRFSNYNISLQFITNELFAQTLAFHEWYFLAAPRSRVRNPALCNRAVTDFIAWCGRGGA
jgi:hypothetical protein